MVSASESLLLLILISISSFLFLNSQFMRAPWDPKNKPAQENVRLEGITNLGFLNKGYVGDHIEQVSGEDNVGGETGTKVLTKLRVLFRLEASISSSSRMHKSYPHLPAPAPVEEAMTPAPVPSLHRTRLRSRSPSHHGRRIPPVHSLYARRDADKTRFRRTVIAVVASVGATLVILGVAIVLVCKRSKRTQRKRSERLVLVSDSRSKTQMLTGSSSKVSFDPGLQELFYLNSLSPFLGSDSSLKQSCESKNVLPNKSMPSSPSPTEESRKCGSENVICSDEEKVTMETLPSDDESFHSVCCGHSSDGSASDVDESVANLNHCSANCYPCNSSYRSISSSCRLPQFFPRKSTIVSDSVNLTHPASTCPSQSMETIELQTPNSLGIQDREILFSSQSSLPFDVQTQQTNIATTIYSSELRIALLKPHSPSNDSKHSLPMPETSSAPSKLESCLTERRTTNGTMSSPNSGDNVHKPTQPPLVPLVGNGGIPKPPPPPPPLLKPPSFPKGCNSGQPPPPPPCPFQLTMPVGKDGAPLPKLKPLHWDKVRAAPDRSMVWDKIRASSFEFDEQMIESLFGYNSKCSLKNEEAMNKTPSPSKHVMEHKRLQNITILMKAINATAEQVCEALVQGGGLSVQQLEALVKMTPTKEEEEKFFAYEGDVGELVSAEKFVKMVLTVPLAFSRIEVMLYREMFEDEVDHLRKSFAMLEEACKELRSSQLFLRLLEAVLKTGNRMNIGTIRGGARAFKLDALLKLADVKGTDGKTTLLHFVVQEMIRSEGVSAVEGACPTNTSKNTPRTSQEKEEAYRTTGLDLVSGLSTELCNVKKTASIDLDVLVSSVSNLSNGMDQLKHLVEVDLSTDHDRNGSFVCSMKSFLEHAEKIIRELKNEENEVLLHVREITEYYHGDVGKDEANPLRIFVIVRDFLTSLDRVCKEVKGSKRGPNPFISFR